VVYLDLMTAVVGAHAMEPAVLPDLVEETTDSPEERSVLLNQDLTELVLATGDPKDKGSPLLSLLLAPQNLVCSLVPSL